MNIADEIEASWGLLRAPRAGDRSVESRRIPGDRWGEVLLALDDEGRRHLLIPVGEDAPLQEDRSAAGVHVVEHRLVAQGRMRRFVDIYCRKPHLDELFTPIVVEVLERLERGTPPDAAAIQTLERWRELLTTESTSLPSVQRLTGIFGELVGLHELLQRNHTLSSAWVGPAGARHDLMTPTGAVEVKTTLTRTGWMVEVHGLDQLEGPARGPLVLMVMRIERHPSEGRSIPAMVDELVSLGGDHAAILERLGEVGVGPDVLPHIAPLRFVERERRAFLVRDSFPRLTAGMLKSSMPPEVVDLNYRLDLNAVAPLNSADEERLLTEVAG